MGIRIGCCGWSYLRKEDFPDELAGRYSSKLQAYAALFDTVEINSSFYRIPRSSTARKWRVEADEMNPDFEFTVKAYQGITHLHRFRGNESIRSFDLLTELAGELRSRLILFQSPASFRPTDENVGNMEDFFGRIARGDIVLAWEPRGTWYDRTDLIEKICLDCRLVHCVDPFRNDMTRMVETGISYFRLHGFGRPSMYRYDFSDEELNRLWEKVKSEPAGTGDVYVFFNNQTCYLNARKFREMTR